MLLLRDRGRMEVLMVKRGDGAYFGSALVFPGGKRDASDFDPSWDDHVEGAGTLDRAERAMRIAGWREVFEETGLLPGPCVAASRGADRSEIFLDLVRRSGGRLPLGEMWPFARWITPRMAPERFDVHFYLCALDGEDAVCDGFETVSAEWTTPAEALERGAGGERYLLFPTKSQLRRLGESMTIEQAIAAAAAQPVVTIEPRREVRGDVAFVTIPAGAGYVVTEETIETNRARGAIS
jgi:8-oxo-dGTP pyrophosphatase MutT (NUDIX family)